MRRVSIVLLLAVAVAPRLARAQACYGNIKWQKVYSSFSPLIPGADLQSATPSTTGFTNDGNGGLTMKSTSEPLVTEQIIVPFTQDVPLKMLFQNTANSAVFGWFYWDLVTSNANFWDPVNNVLVDKDGDGVKDFFQWATATRLANGLFARANAANSVPDLVNGAISYSDGGTYAHVPNLVETLIGTGASPTGGLLFKLLDDDPNATYANGYTAVQLPLKTDLRVDVAGGDGIADYDVNGDGTIGNAPDRTVILSQVQGGREIVLWEVSYGGDNSVPGNPWTVANGSVGLSGVGTQTTRTMPFFSKSALNPDSYGSGLAPGASVAAFDAGCALPGPCGVANAWMDNNALARLSTANYGSLAMPAGSNAKVVTSAAGYVPHFVAAPPTSSPNAWLFGVEDSPIQSAACATCTQSDRDYNDNVFLLQPALGGSVTSTLVSTDVLAADVTSTMVTKLRVQANAVFSPPCPSPSAGTPLNAGASRIDLYVSVDGGATWLPVVFPPSSSGTSGFATIDLLQSGVTGSQIYWKANFVFGQDGCLPVLSNLSVGYEGPKHGTFQQGQPLVEAYALIRGQFETVSSAWTPADDKQPRGHLILNQLVNYDTPNQVPIDYTDPSVGTSPPLQWDAGQVLYSTRSPDPMIGATVNGRNIFISAGTVGALTSFVNGVAATQALLLPGSGTSCNAGASGVRCSRGPRGYLYDFDGDGDVEVGVGGVHDDADWLLYWTRGWDNGTTRSVKRWMLGAIERGTPGFLWPPLAAWWAGVIQDPALQAADAAFVSANATRPALTIAGAQDGMLHAFDTGAFRWGDDPTTNFIETHGYFTQLTATQRNFGTGKEMWAFIPPGQMDSLRSAPPRSNMEAAGVARSSLDVDVALADVCLGAPANAGPYTAATCSAVSSCCMATIAVAQETRNHPYVTALDVTNATDGAQAATRPKALWANDWPLNDPVGTFLPSEMPQGGESSPAIGPTTLWGARTFVAALTSGIAQTPMPKLMLYFIDLATGKSTLASGNVAKVQLNVKGSNGIDCSTATTGGVLGSIGSPVMADTNNDGVIDRVYVADTNGCIYKIDTSPVTGPTVCPIASIGESVFAPMAIRTATDVQNDVEIYVGGGDNPDAFDVTDSTAQVPATGYHLFALLDNDGPGQCGAASTIWKAPLTPVGGNLANPQRLWSQPTFSSDAVYVATSTGDELDPCSQAAGLLEAWKLDPAAATGPAINTGTAFITPITLAAGGSGGVRLSDGHLYVNAANATTLSIGSPRTENLQPNGNAARPFGNPLWLER